MSKILANEIANYGDNAPIDLKEGLNIPAGKPIQAAGSAGTSGQLLSTTGSSIAWITPFDGDYGSLTNKPTIPAAQINSDWNASGGVAVINNKPTVPPLPSVTTESAGTAALAYNAGNGQFTYTPPDLSNYNTAYNWGDHSLAGYLTSLGDAAGVTTAKITNWDAAYGWGNHANGGYLTSYTETQTLDDVLTLGATTTQNITTTGKILYANNYDLIGDLPGASTYHGMFAHVHGTGKGYFAHAGAWTELLDVNSSMADLGDVDLTVAPTDGQVLKWEQSSGSWKAANDLTGGGSGGGLALTDLSAGNAAASGGGSLSYNDGTGAFTFTPPDLSGFLTSETDPVFAASAASGVTTLGISNWNTAYSWGNHGAQGYLVGYGAVSNHSDVSITGASNGQLLQYNGSNWTNFTPTYLTSYSETDTLDSVVGRGATTNKNFTLTGAPSLPGRLDVQNNGSFAISLNASPGVGISTADGIGLFIGNLSTNVWRATIDGATGAITGASLSTAGSLTAGSMTVGGLSYPTVNGTNGHVLTSDGAGNVSWAAQSGGGGGASVTISDTPPAASAGDLWWESDTGRLKIYYQDTDTIQWVDVNAPLRQDRIATTGAPSAASDTGVAGDIRYDSGYVYIAVATNTWKRAALTTW